MLSRISKMLSLRSWSRDDRSWCSAIGVSVLLHIGLILLLALLHSRLVRAIDVSNIETRWSREDIKKEGIDFEKIVLMDPVKTNQAGGTAARFAARTGNFQSASLSVSPSLRDVFSEVPEEGSFEEELFEEVGEFSESSQFGSGKGVGNGAGDGFFGLKAEGMRFVYVVDASQSMNHPHDGPAKTRFRRLKIELVNSISALNGNNDFFIVFFNKDAIPMPARNMQPGFLSNRKRYLQWAAKVQADGKTDPRKALSLALSLNPDVIYFLTDGAFKKKIEHDLRKLAQNRTVIHTIAFGNRNAEEVLKAVAFANGGKFHFIP